MCNAPTEAASHIQGTDMGVYTAKLLLLLLLLLPAMPHHHHHHHYTFG
jgi:hypothetical protein